MKITLPARPSAADLSFHFAAQQAITDKQQPRVRNLRENLGERGDQIRMALESEQPADFADDEIAFREAKLPAERQVVGRVQERFQVKTAENAREHCRLADAGGEIQSGHRVGGTEKMVGDAGGVFFGGGEDPSWRARLGNFRTTGRGCDE